jgi:NADH dehydrogenase [ubiquinone] 1 alpha subcomplex assembly factor 7
MATEMDLPKDSMLLEERIRQHIHIKGPLSVADFMAQVLYDPIDGYYATKIPIGRDGDYITAPETTQVFGEVIAGWLIDTWQKSGSPAPFHLVEMGPGRGTLMTDILRAFNALKIPAPSVHLVEISPPLIEIQKAKLTNASWHRDLSTLPIDQGFCIMIANEFWDALPIRQEVNVEGKWIERCVSLEDDQLLFLPQGKVQEISPLMPNLTLQIAHHLKQNGGAALFFDYGYDQPNAMGDTLQALYKHQKVSPLSYIGQADLTHHVDFHRLKQLFQETSMFVHGPTTQGDFLKAIGLMERTEQLCQQATPDQQGPLKTAAIRLTHPTQMGSLFKVLAITSSNKLVPAGF